MKSILFLLSLLAFTSQLSAQEKHFLFVQSENRQPFFVMLNGKNYSSTAAGYVIIPKLTEGEYSFSIGFAKDEIPEQPFRIDIPGRDVGVLLKNLGDKGWALFNLQTMSLTMAGEVKQQSVAKKVQVQEDEPISFNRKPSPPVTQVPEAKLDTTTAAVVTGKTDTAAIVSTTATVDTTSQANNTVVNSQVTSTESGIDTTATVIVSVNPVADTAAVALNVVLDKPVVETSRKKNNRRNNKITKVSETTATDGTTLTYVDADGNKQDTVQVIIPSEPVVAADEKKTTTSGTTAETNLTASISQDNSTPGKTPEQSTLDSTSVSTTATTSACKAMATEEDYAKLRKKMAREMTDEEMMKEALKFYRSKCFTTIQIRALSTLFLSDESRYNFFQTSLEFVADPAEYSILEKEFIDPAYSTRFKNLLRK